VLADHDFGLTGHLSSRTSSTGICRIIATCRGLLAATDADMAGNNYMNFPHPRWRSNYFYEENYGPMQ